MARPRAASRRIEPSDTPAKARPSHSPRRSRASTASRLFCACAHDEHAFAGGLQLAVGERSQYIGGPRVALGDERAEGLYPLVAFAEGELFNGSAVQRRSRRRNEKGEDATERPRPLACPHFLTAIRAGSSTFLSLPGMNGLHGCAFTGPLVFHTTLNWPSAFTSPMNTAL